MKVRPYRPADREAVRAICHQTGYLGSTAEWFWRDRRSFADLFTAYYTDVEPESAQVVVAERGDDAPRGVVIGYLLGAVDASAVPAVTEVLLPHVLGRLVALRPGTAGVIWRGLADVAAGLAAGRGIPEERFADPRYPSNFHLDLLPPARGHGLGQVLVESWLDRLRAAGSPGCHLEAVAENTAAVAFFRRMGFALEGRPRIAPGWRHREGHPLHVQTMVRAV